MSEPRPARRTTMGLTSDSFQSIRFSSPQRLLEVNRLMELAARVGAAGAHGGMTRIDFDWARATRKMKEELDMYVEIQTFLPREDPVVFEHAVKVAKEAGASSLRVVCLLGRRYEMFESLEDWRTAVEGFHKQIATALPIVEKHRMPLGIENHKDWRVDQQVALLEQYSSDTRRQPRYREQPDRPRRSDRDGGEARAVHVQRSLQGYGRGGDRERLPPVGGAAG